MTAYHIIRLSSSADSRVVQVEFLRFRQNLGAVKLSIWTLSVIALFWYAFQPLQASEVEIAHEANQILGDRYALPVFDESTATALDATCGEEDESIDIENFESTDLFDANVFSKAKEAVVIFQWNRAQAIASQLPGYSSGNIANHKWCTGSLIHGSYILTAGHCIIPHNTRRVTTPYKKEGEKKIWASPQQLATIMKVHFDYRKNSITGRAKLSKSYSVEYIDHEVKGSDFALLKIVDDGNQVVFRNRYSFKLNAAEVKKNDDIAILQHSNGEPLKIAMGSVFETNERILKYNNLDTLNGSSGSPVLSLSGDIVGVHTKGGCGRKRGANRGYRLDRLTQRLLTRIDEE